MHLNYKVMKRSYQVLSHSHLLSFFNVFLVNAADSALAHGKGLGRFLHYAHLVKMFEV